MATITIPLFLIEVAGPALLALAVGAAFAALTWEPPSREADPIWAVAVIEVVVVGFGVAVWQGITGNAAIAGAGLAVALIGLVPALRLISAAERRGFDEGWQYEVDDERRPRNPAGDALDRTYVVTALGARAHGEPQRLSDRSTCSSLIGTSQPGAQPAMTQCGARHSNQVGSRH